MNDRAEMPIAKRWIAVRIDRQSDNRWPKVCSDSAATLRTALLQWLDHADPDAALKSIDREACLKWAQEHVLERFGQSAQPCLVIDPWLPGCALVLCDADVDLDDWRTAETVG